MKTISVTLHTGTHCIETEAKNSFRRLTGQLLETENEQEAAVLGQQLGLLREFIGTADFNALRASDERLAGIVQGICVVARNSNGKVTVTEIYDPG